MILPSPTLEGRHHVSRLHATLDPSGNTSKPATMGAGNSKESSFAAEHVFSSYVSLGELNATPMAMRDL